MGGAVPSGRIKSLADQVGIGTKALRTARERLGVVATRNGNGATMRSSWALPIELCPAVRGYDDRVRTHALDDSSSNRAPRRSPEEMLTIAKVGDLKKPVGRITPDSTIQAAPALGSGDLDAVSMAHKVLTSARNFSASPEQCADTLLEQERPRVALRVRQFVQLGMNESAGRELAIRLVVQRDRVGSKAGSCIECQCLHGVLCAAGAAGHAHGPRDASEIWLCWCARRN